MTEQNTVVIARRVDTHDPPAVEFEEDGEIRSNLECHGCGYTPSLRELPCPACPKCGGISFEQRFNEPSVVDLTTKRRLGKPTSVSDVTKAYKRMHPEDSCSKTTIFMALLSAEEKFREGALRVGLGPLLGIQPMEVWRRSIRFPQHNDWPLPRFRRRIRECVGQMRLF